MTWLAALLVLLLLKDALKIRGRLGSIEVARPSDEPVEGEHAFVVAEGVNLDEATRRAASAHARSRGLRVLDLVPRDLWASDALGFAFVVDPRQVRRERLAPGRTARHAMLVARDVLGRARVPEPGAPLDPVAFAALASRLKRYACLQTDLAIVPGLRAVREPPSRRLAVLREVLGRPGASFVIGAQAVLLSLLVLVAMYGGYAGLAAIATFHVQPLLALAGLRAAGDAGGPGLAPRGVLISSLFRTPLEAWDFLRLVLGRWRPPAEDPVEALRPEYERLLARLSEGMFEPRATQCPLCGSAELAPHLRVVDMLQGKPGRFSLERCRGCGHVFQNPRLSIEGLGFYYRDFYDGLGERGLDFIFASSTAPYLARARMVAPFAAPKRWLDVGCGHGHFCCVAREVWPEARFEGLDIAEGVEEAARRGWVDAGYRGLFPELAAELAGRSDVVSMSHYLEHTIDPRAEIRAAAVALEPGGLLLIEVPDPESALGRWLGRLWLPWFQPQHLHFVSVANLDRILREVGFEPLAWHRGEAHQAVDFFLGAVLLLRRIAPDPQLPWRPRAGPARLLWGKLVWTAGLPLILLGRTADGLLAPLFRRPGLSNTYRVVARKL